MSWPSKGRPAFHKCPAPQAFPEKKKKLKKSSIEKIHVAVEISTVTGWWCQATASNVILLMPRPPSQRESNLMGPLLWAQVVLSRSPYGRIWVYSPGEGQRGGRPCVSLPPFFLYARFSKSSPGDSQVQPGDVNPGSSSLPIPFIPQKRSLRRREVE